jgi:hypothetical protein
VFARAAAALAVLFVGLGLPARALDPATSPEARLLKQYALRHDVASILAIQRRVDALHDPALRGVYDLALYLADKRRFEAYYVHRYPWRDLSVVSSAFSVPPQSGFGIVEPIDALGAIAERGNTDAIGMLMLGKNHSDGVTAEGPDTFLMHAAAKWPRQTVAALRRLPAGERERAAHDGCLHQSTLLRLRPNDGIERNLIAIVRATPAQCP